jgi:hypothetical protein
MNYKFLLNRFFDILFKPTKAWKSINSDNESIKDTRNNYLFPLLILVTIFTFLGSMLFTDKEMTFIYSVFVSLKFLATLLFVIYASAWIHKEITYALDLGRSFTVSFRIIVYSLTPLFICLSISNFLESLVFVDILALYGLYIFWAGCEKMLNPPDYKKMPMLIATFVSIAVFYIAGIMVLGQIFDRLYFSVFA